MNWYEYRITVPECHHTVIDGVDKLFINDENLKPHWVAYPANYTEFHVKRNKDTLLIIVGESWTYGESLPNVATGAQQYSLDSQLVNCFGPKIAVMLNSDLYQYAVPGNCNLYISMELERILEYVSTMHYKKIYVCIQMTECGRDNAVVEANPNSILSSLINGNIKEDTFDNWLKKYDETFFEYYSQLLKKYKNLNLDAVIWKNFCKTNTNLRNYEFKIIETSWIQYSAKILGVKLEMPKFFASGWLDHIKHKDPGFKKIIFDDEMILEELNKIEKSLDLIKSNQLHRQHPSATGHTLWAQYLARMSGWVDGI